MNERRKKRKKNQQKPKVHKVDGGSCMLANLYISLLIACVSDSLSCPSRALPYGVGRGLPPVGDVVFSTFV